jgi:hypothetical protein
VDYMARISPEEKRREASDWFIGFLGIVLILGALLLGYSIYNFVNHNKEQKRVYQSEQPSKALPEKPGQTAKPVS